MSCFKPEGQDYHHEPKVEMVCPKSKVEMVCLELKVEMVCLEMDDLGSKALTARPKDQHELNCAEGGDWLV